VFTQTRAYFVGTKEVAALGGGIACFDLGGDLIAVLPNPNLLLVEHLHRAFHNGCENERRSLHGT